MNVPMKLDHSQCLLRISDLQELSAANSNHIRDQVRARLTDTHKIIEVDLSQTLFMDSSGLGALISLYKSICGRKGMVRLLNPSPPVQQVLEMTRMHRLFVVQSA
jgi:anti-sigma B factor antagonist